MPVKMLPAGKEWAGWEDSSRMYQLTRSINRPRKPRLGRRPIPLVHGTRAGYNKRGNPCRCDLCGAANKEYLNNRKANIKYIPPRVHGTENGYRHFNCRCEKCCAAVRKIWAQRARCRRKKCRHVFEADGRRKYCSEACRIAANVKHRREYDRLQKEGKRKLALTKVSV